MIQSKFLTSLSDTIINIYFQLRYIALFEGQFPFTKSKVKFTKGDVTEVADSGVLPWRDSRYKISNRNVLLLSEFFKTPSELFEMMKKPTEKTD